MFHAKFQLNPLSNSGEVVEIYFQDGHHGHFYKSKPAQNPEGPHQGFEVKWPISSAEVEKAKHLHMVVEWRDVQTDTKS